MRMLDLYPAGTRLELGSVTFTAEDIIRFAEKFDPQPFHVDPEAAKALLALWDGFDETGPVPLDDAIAALRAAAAKAEGR